MKKILKEIVAVVLCVATLFSLTACGPGSKKTSNEVETLIWYVPGDKQDGLQRVLDEVNKIIESKIGARLDLRFIDQASFTERLQMLMASREEFDLMYCGNNQPNSLNEAYLKGGVMDITDYVEGDSEFKNLLPDYAWKAASFDGRIYAVPNQQIWAMRLALGLRKDLVDKYGFDVESLRKKDNTEAIWDGVEEFWELVKKNDPDLFPFYCSRSDDVKHADDYTSLVTHVAAIDNQTGELFPYITSDASRENARYRKEWYEKGYLRKDIATATNQEGDYMAGRYASLILTYKPGTEVNEKNRTNYDWEFIPVTTPKIDRGNIVATTTAVSSTSKHPDKAIELIKLVNTDKEVYNMICHGIEGIDYEKIDDTIIRPKKENGYFIQGEGWQFGNQFNSLIREGNSADVWEKTKELNENAIILPSIGFVFDAESTTTYAAQLVTAMARYPISKGMVDPDKDWDNLIADVKKAGFDEYYAEVQRQYNEYLKNRK